MTILETLTEHMNFILYKEGAICPSPQSVPCITLQGYVIVEQGLHSCLKIASRMHCHLCRLLTGDVHCSCIRTLASESIVGRERKVPASLTSCKFKQYCPNTKCLQEKKAYLPTLHFKRRTSTLIIAVRAIFV